MVGNLISLGGETTLYYANDNGWIEFWEEGGVNKFCKMIEALVKTQSFFQF